MNLEGNKVREEEHDEQASQQVADRPSLFARLRTSIVSGTSKGVTLIELLAVIAILAVIAAVAIPVVKNSINNAKISTTKQNLQIISSALQRYYADHNSYPQTSGWIDANTGNVTGSKTLTSVLSSYVKGIPQDGWSTDFAYESTSSSTYKLATGKSAPSGTVSNVSSSDEAFYVTDSTGQPQSGTAPTP